MLTLTTLNQLDQDAFVAAIGHVFEHSPWIAAEAWLQRPFADRTALHAAMVAVLDAAEEAPQLALIRAHPDLAGRLAQSGQLTVESAREQAAAGLMTLSAEEQAQLAAYNTAYQAQFGFPFVICARENKKAAIMAAFPRRLANQRASEIATALTEIKQIAWFRLCDVVSP
ncbi:MAG: 2-oxo-4-hydroxy-4-carboxy-5-ureidoimidazoline decarboxylase [Oscillochloridaceae bacterium umkhey_bin13]